MLGYLPGALPSLCDCWRSLQMATKTEPSGVDEAPGEGHGDETRILTAAQRQRMRQGYMCPNIHCMYKYCECGLGCTCNVSKEGPERQSHPCERQRATVDRGSEAIAADVVVVVLVWEGGSGHTGLPHAVGLHGVYRSPSRAAYTLCPWTLVGVSPSGVLGPAGASPLAASWAPLYRVYCMFMVLNDCTWHGRFQTLPRAALGRSSLFLGLPD
eukprot:scaffold246_cov414-Prasinococcus_capsulatus_cf.AAC.21